MIKLISSFLFLASCGAAMAISSISGKAELRGLMEVESKSVTLTQIVTIPCFVETDPVIPNLANTIGFHKADFGTHAWSDLNLSVLTFNLSTQTQIIHFEQNFVTNIAFPNLIVGNQSSGDILLRGDSLSAFAAPLLASLHKFDNQTSLAITNISLPALSYLFSFAQWSAPILPSVSLPSLTNSFVMDLHDNGSMTGFSAPLWKPANGGVFDFSDCALTATAVNHILARAVASTAFVSGTLDLSGGTSSAPTGQGSTDKATLIARGVSVSTN